MKGQSMNQSNVFYEAFYTSAVVTKCLISDVFIKKLPGNSPLVLLLLSQWSRPVGGGGQCGGRPPGVCGPRPGCFRAAPQTPHRQEEDTAPSAAGERGNRHWKDTNCILGHTLDMRI